jgi:hypothetical protein
MFKNDGEQPYTYFTQINRYWIYIILKQLILNIFEIQGGNHLGQRHQVKKFRNRLTDDFMKFLEVVTW